MGETPGFQTLPDRSVKPGGCEKVRAKDLIVKLKTRNNFKNIGGTGREAPSPLVLVLVGEGSNFMWRKKVTAAKLGVHGNDKTE